MSTDIVPVVVVGDRRKSHIDHFMGPLHDRVRTVADPPGSVARHLAIGIRPFAVAVEGGRVRHRPG